MNHERVLERLRDPEFFSRTGTPGEIAAAADLIDRITAERDAAREDALRGFNKGYAESVARAERAEAENDGLRKALEELIEWFDSDDQLTPFGTIEAARATLRVTDAEKKGVA